MATCAEDENKSFIAEVDNSSDVNSTVPPDNSTTCEVETPTPKIEMNENSSRHGDIDSGTPEQKQSPFPKGWRQEESLAYIPKSRVLGLPPSSAYDEFTVEEVFDLIHIVESEILSINDTKLSIDATTYELQQLCSTDLLTHLLPQTYTADVNMTEPNPFTEEVLAGMEKLETWLIDCQMSLLHLKQKSHLKWFQILQSTVATIRMYPPSVFQECLKSLKDCILEMIEMMQREIHSLANTIDEFEFVFTNHVNLNKTEEYIVDIHNYYQGKKP